MADFTLPELGENITAGDVLNVLVKVGDTVARDQAVLELETDKATIEVPSSISGKVTAIKVKAGDKVKVGQAILSLEDNGVPASAAPPKAAPVAAPPQPPPPAEAPAPVERIRPAVEKDNVVDISRGTRPAQAPPPIAQAASAGSSAPAAPSVRRMARELGVNIDEVAGTGDDGRISIDDVKGARQASHHDGRIRRRRSAVRPASRCRISADGAPSSVSRCAASGRRRPSIWAHRGRRFRS